MLPCSWKIKAISQYCHWAPQHSA